MLTEIKDATETNISASHLDYYLCIDNGKRATKLTRGNDFKFPIVKFPFLSRNIPSTPAHGVYVSQIVSYATACCKYQVFVDRGICLVGCFGFNGRLRQYFSLHRPVSQRKGERCSKTQRRVKMSKQPPPVNCCHRVFAERSLFQK